MTPAALNPKRRIKSLRAIAIGIGVFLRVRERLLERIGALSSSYTPRAANSQRFRAARDQRLSSYKPQIYQTATSMFDPATSEKRMRGVQLWPLAHISRPGGAFCHASVLRERSVRRICSPRGCSMVYRVGGGQVNFSSTTFSNVPAPERRDDAFRRA